jgi:hypothetical protein
MPPSKNQEHHGSKLEAIIDTPWPSQKHQLGGLGHLTSRPDQQIAQDKTCDFWVTSKE